MQNEALHRTKFVGFGVLVFWDSGVCGLGFGVLGFWVWGFGFGVWGWGLGFMI